MKLEHITSLHSHVYLCDRLHLTVQNNSHEARPGSSLASALLLQLPLSPVTLTHFSKMQPPVEPTSLPATTFAQRGQEGGRKKRQSGRHGGKRKGVNLDWMVYSAHSQVPTLKEI